MESKEVFEEWSLYAQRKKLLPRIVDLDFIIRNSNSKIISISGIRRSGKSSVLMLLAQKISASGKRVGYINVEDSRIKNNKTLLDDSLMWFGEDGFLLLDEITSANDWDGWLARNHELLKGRLFLVVSSSRRGIVFPSKSLRGRMLPSELYPLSFREFLEFKGLKTEPTTAGRGVLENTISEYLKYGGFPEVVLASEEIDKIDILSSYFKDILALDIAEVSHGDISIVETFGRYITQSSYFSASKCFNFLKTLGYKIGKEKILGLERYSEAAYLFFFVPIFSYNIKDRSQYPRKAYCGDTGFIFANTGKVDFGRLYETAVFLELRRRTQWRGEICYWKNKEGFEADFILKRGNDVQEAIQVVYDFEDEKTKKREIRALLKCIKELKPHKAIIITKNVNERKIIEGVEIIFIPLWKWLLDL